MKTVLITGVARGLGKILLDFLSKQQCKVYGTVRNLENCLDTELIKHIYLDLQNTPSIDKAVSKITEDTDSIDVLIHNAAIAYLNPADEMTDIERRDVFDVNFFGPIYLTEKLLPTFRKNKKGKIIIISSIASLDTWPGLGIYSASKAALEKVAFEWAVLLKKWNIDVAIIRPNPLPTNMQMLKSVNTNSSTYGDVFCNELLWESPETVCNIIWEIMHSNNARFEYSTGQQSQRTVDSICKKNALQRLINKYRRNLIKKMT